MYFGICSAIIGFAIVFTVLQMAYYNIIRLAQNDANKL